MAEEPTLGAAQIEAIKAEIRKAAKNELKAFPQATLALAAPMKTLMHIEQQIQAAAGENVEAGLQQQLTVAIGVMRQTRANYDQACRSLFDAILPIFYDHKLSIDGVSQEPPYLETAEMSQAARIYHDVAHEAIKALIAARDNPSHPHPYVQVPVMDRTRLEADARERQGGWRP